MIHNQCPFEVIRDIATVLLNMKSGKSHEIRLNKHGTLIDWQLIGTNEPCGPSEAACLMEDAYQIVYGEANKELLVTTLLDRLKLFGYMSREPTSDPMNLSTVEHCLNCGNIYKSGFICPACKTT